jgi:twinkle protein
VADLEYPYEFLNEKLRGIRKREMATIVAGTGCGKSTLCREIALSALQQGKKVGYVALEESANKTGRMLLALLAETPWLDFNPSEEYIRKQFDDHLRGKFYTYKHFGSLDDRVLLGHIKYLSKVLGVDVVVLDHISIVVSGMDGDERTSLDRLVTRMRSTVEDSDMALFIVSHLKKADGKAHENGGEITLKDIRSSNSVAQISDVVIALERDQQADTDADVTTVRILKNRPTGVTGICGRLQYVPETGRQIPYDGPHLGDSEDSDWTDDEELL